MIWAKKFWPMPVVALAGALTIWGCQNSPESDTAPPRSDSTPRAEIPQPAARRAGGVNNFAGMETCAKCHPEQMRSFERSGHSHTFSHLDNSPVAGQLAGQTFQDPERGYTFHYHFNAGGLAVSIPEKFGDERFPLQYVLGSGTHAVTFLTLIPGPGPGHENVGIEHRVSAYGAESALALTPGQTGRSPKDKMEHFGARVEGDKLDRCIGCHVTSGEVRNQEVVQLRPNVSCESCHGKGGNHARLMERDSAGAAPQIASQWSAGGQIRMCGHCHRTAESLAAPPERSNRKLARFQSVGLAQSRCYQAASGKLSCTTCHDPHDAVATDHHLYDRHCLQCHQPERKGQIPCKSSAASHCGDCHMPAIEVIPGVKFHDHWIRVRNPSDPAADLPENAE